MQASALAPDIGNPRDSLVAGDWLTPPDLGRYLARRFAMKTDEEFARIITSLMSAYVASDPDTRELGRTLDALPVGFDLMTEYFIRPDGNVVAVDHGHDTRPIHVTNDRRSLITTLLIGSRTHPALKTLLPNRTTIDQDCAACTGTGRLFNDKTFCPECGGVGWLTETAR